MDWMAKQARQRAPSVGEWLAAVTAGLACVAAALTVLAALLQLVAASWAR